MMEEPFVPFYLFFAACFVSTVSSMGRFCLGSFFLDRPLVQGFFWGLLSGDMALAISVSLIFEMLWLDLVPIGSYIPPGRAVTGLALGLISIFNLHTAQEIILPVLLVLPVSRATVWIEKIMRRWYNKKFKTLHNWLQSGQESVYRPGLLIGQSLVQSFMVYLAFFSISLFLLMIFMDRVVMRENLILYMPQVSFNHLFLGAAIGGLLALRIVKSYICFVLGLGTVIFFLLFF